MQSMQKQNIVIFWCMSTPSPFCILRLIAPVLASQFRRFTALWSKTCGLQTGGSAGLFLPSIEQENFDIFWCRLNMCLSVFYCRGLPLMKDSS